MNRPEAAPARERLLTVWSIPVVLLFALWLLLAFSAGGFQQHQWLLPGIGVAAFALVVGILAAYPRRPRQLSMAVLTLLTLYAGWVALSAAWAPSLNAVWDETGRTLVYLLALTLALIYLTDAGARRVARYLFVIGALLLVELVVSRLQLSTAAAIGDTEGGGGAIEGLFFVKRFVYPAGYPNNAAALYLGLFWPLLWVAADPKEWVPMRAVSLAGCWGLLALAIMTQSRGGLWAGVITTILLFALSPARLRTLVYLLVPAALAVWGFPDLNSYWRLGPGAVGGSTAVRVVLIGMAVSAAIGLALALLERWVRVSRKMKVVFGAGVLIVLVAGLVYGGTVFEQRVGDPTEWARTSWDNFTADKMTVLPGQSAEGEQSSRFSTFSASGRWDIWRVAWLDFREEPFRGIGAGNYVYTHDELRHNAGAKPRQPHNHALQVLSETGTVGGVLFFGAFALGLGGMLWPRFSAGWQSLRRRAEGNAGRWGSDPAEYAWETALAVGVLYWHVHGSAEWLWHMPGVTLPTVFMFALGIASVDAKAGIFWPRVAAFLPKLPMILPFLTPPMLLMMRRRMAGSRSQEEAQEGLDNRTARRRRRDAVLRPLGPISRWFRWTVVGVAAVTFVGLALLYSSLQLQSAALANAGSDDAAAVRLAEIAGRLVPVDPAPTLTEAVIYRMASAGASTETAGDDLALALDAHMRAIARNPVDWTVHYGAGMAAMRLLEHALGRPSGELTGMPSPSGTGAGAGDTLVTAESRDRVEAIRAFSPEELRLLARSYLLAAQQRNPLDGRTAAALQRLEEAAALTGLD